MASKTQLRLGQITGSFGDREGGIVDSLAADSGGTIAAIALHSASLVGVLSEMASAIKRIHGGTTFAHNAAGIFDQDLKPDADGSRDLGATDAEWAEVHTNQVRSQVALVISGASINVDADAGAVNIDGSSGINIGTEADVAVDFNASTFDLDASAAVTIDGTGISIDGSAASNFSISDGDLTIEAAGTDNKVLIAGGHVAGTAVHIDANDNANSVLDIDAGKVDIDAQGTIDIDGTGISLDSDAASNFSTSAGDLSITSTGAKVVLSGSSAADSVHVQSPATFDDNVIIAGNLDVNGTVTTIDTTNLTVKDRLLGLNYDDGTAQALADIGLVFGNSGGNQKAFFWDNSDTEFAFVDTANTAADSAITPASYANIRAGAIEGSSFVSSITNDQVVISNNGTLEGDANLTFDGSDLQLANNVGLVFSTDDAEKIESDGTDLTISSGGDVILNALGEHILLKSGSTEFGFLKKSNNDLHLSASAGDLVVGLQGQAITVARQEENFLQIQYNTGNVVIKPMVTNGDLIFNEDGPNEVFRLDSSALSLLVSGSNKIEFRDTGTLIHSPEDGELKIESDGTGEKAVWLQAGAGDIKLQAEGDDIFFQGQDPQPGMAFNRGTQTVNYLNFTNDASNPLTTGTGGIGFRSNAGTMQFKNQGGNWTDFSAGGRDQKVTYMVSSSIPVNQAIALNTANGASGNLSWTDTFKSSDVYVNGQLMLSGTSAANGDYKHANSVSCEFFFALEADDQITVVVYS